MDWLMDFFGNFFNGIIDFFVKLFTEWIPGFFIDAFNFFAGGLAELVENWLISIGLTIEIPEGLYSGLNVLTRSIGYILPMAALSPIVIFMLVFYIAKIVFAIYKVIANTIIKKISIKGG